MWTYLDWALWHQETVKDAGWLRHKLFWYFFVFCVHIEMFTEQKPWNNGNKIFPWGCTKHIWRTRLLSQNISAALHYYAAVEQHCRFYSQLLHGHCNRGFTQQSNSNQTVALCHSLKHNSCFQIDVHLSTVTTSTLPLHIHQFENIGTFNSKTDLCTQTTQPEQNMYESSGHGFCMCKQRANYSPTILDVSQS